MIVSMVLAGEEVLEAYESLLLDIIEPWEAEDERRSEERMLEKERDWKRCCLEGILNDVEVDVKFGSVMEWGGMM